MTTLRADGAPGGGLVVRSSGPAGDRAASTLRLVRLYAVSRRVPVAVGVLAACGAVLRAVLAWHWAMGSHPQQLPVLVEAGAASVVAVTTHGPFGEPERAAGRWLPFLRCGTAVALSGIAVGFLAAGAAGAHLPGGTLDVLRNVAGITGIGMLSAAAIGGGLCWIGPMAYLVVSEYAILNDWRTPWVWPDRPPHDVGAALCASLAFAIGVVCITVLGADQRTVRSSGHRGGASKRSAVETSTRSS